MAAPTTQFKDIATSTVLADLDTAAERITAMASGTTVDNSGSLPWDFTAGGTLTVDISAGRNFSPVRMIFWDVTANGGNTTVDNFKFWFSNTGFAQAGSRLMFAPLAFTGSPANNQLYTANAITTSYTFAEADEGGTPPGSQNCWAADDTTSIDISTPPNDVVAVAAYFDIDGSEDTGTYKGTDSGYECQCSFKYDYS